jgi:hypothetical protein
MDINLIIIILLIKSMMIIQIRIISITNLRIKDIRR